MHDIGGVQEVCGTEHIVCNYFNVLHLEVFEIHIEKQTFHIVGNVVHDKEDTLSTLQSSFIIRCHHDFLQFRSKYVFFHGCELPKDGEFS